MKLCRKCGLLKPLSDFNANRGAADGKQAKCRPCQVTANREWAERNPEKNRAQKRRQSERRKRNRNVAPEKRRAHKAVEMAILAGRLVRPAVCPSCRDPRYKVQAHHHDYSKPLDIDWLCAKCHGRLHAQEGSA